MRYWGLMRIIVVGCGLLVGLLSTHVAGAAVSLQTSFNSSGTYTDNLFFRNEDAEEDFGTFFGPDVTLLFENPDIVIGASYTGRVALYLNNSDVNRYNQNANIILDLPFLTKQYRGLSVSIDESMNFTPQLDAFSFSEAENVSSLPRANSGLSGGGSTGGTAGSGSGTGGAGGAGGLGGSGGSSGGLGGSGGTQGLFTRRSSAFFNNAGLTLGYIWGSRFNTTLGYSNQYRHFFSKGFQDSMTHAAPFRRPIK